jgi:hypothetical protein
LRPLLNGITEVQLEAVVIPGPKDPLRKPVIQQGMWLDSSTTLSIHCKLSLPLVVKNEQTTELNHGSTTTKPILPMYIITNCKHAAVEIAKAIYYVNGHAFNLEENADMLDGLNAIRMTEEDSMKDVLGGFEFIDCDYSIFYIEGHESTIQKIQNFVENESARSCKCIKLDSLRSSNRIRPLVSPTLLHILVEPSVQEICKWTSTYLQKQINADCYQCLSLLYQLANFYSTGSFGGILPPLKLGMIFSLLKSYGKIFTLKELIRRAETYKNRFGQPAPTNSMFLNTITQSIANHVDDSSSGSRDSKPKVDSNNPLMKKLEIRKMRRPNFLSINSQVLEI